MADIFQYGTFTSHSGLQLPWKLDLDALTDGDFEALAEIVRQKFSFGHVVGVPRGGLRFAEALRPHCQVGYPTLIVDDVLTTGKSMIQAREMLMASCRYEPVVGVVIVSRCGRHTGCLDWIYPVMTVNELFQCRAISDA